MSPNRRASIANLSFIIFTTMLLDHCEAGSTLVGFASEQDKAHNLSASASSKSLRDPKLFTNINATCNDFLIGPYYYSQFKASKDGSISYAIPLKLTLTACLDGSTAYTDTFHLSARVRGRLEEIQKTLNSVASENCAQQDEMSKIPSTFSSSLSQVSIISTTGTKELRRMVLEATLKASPCRNWSLKDVIPIDILSKMELNLTNTAFYFDIQLPIDIDAKTLVISFDEPVVKFNHYQHMGATTASEMAFDAIGPKRFSVFRTFIAARAKDVITEHLTTLRPGDLIPKELFSGVYVGDANISTAGETLDFDLSLTGEVPRPTLEAVIKDLIFARSGLE